MSIVIRPAQMENAPAIAQVHVESWRSTYRGLLPDAVLDNLSVERRQAQWEAVLQRGNSCLYIAVTAGEEIVGFASAGRGRGDHPDYEGELYAIYLLESYQGQGIGRQLFEAVVRWLRDQGHSSMLLWVLQKNPAEHFYQAMGGIRVMEKTEDIGGRAVIEIAYGWQNLGDLA